jgi:hypothetical protein
VSEPHVLNRHHFRGRAFPPGSFYVGRPGSFARKVFAEHPELGDLTALGNPFRVEEYGEASLGLYRRYLFAAMRGGGKVMDTLSEIGPDSSLVCSCVRKDGSGECHAKVIVKAWKWARRTGLLREVSP